MTGATGFMGSRLLRRLAGRYEVCALARTASRPEACPADGIEWVPGDLRSLDASALPSRIDAVIHLAQSRADREFPERASDIFAVNVKGTADLLEHARRSGARSFVLASSGSVYGLSRDAFREVDPPHPAGYYAATKVAAEALASCYGPYFAVTILRFFYPYGPGQTGRLIASLLRKVLAGERIVIDGEAGPRLNPLYVDDALRAVEARLCAADAGAARGGVCNVAGDEVVTVTDLVRLVEEATGRRALVERREARVGDCIGDNTLMKETLGVRPEVSLREGLRRTIDSWVEVHGGR